MIIRNILVAAILTSIWLAADFYDVKVSKLPDFDYDLQLILLLVAMLFWISNRALWPELPIMKRNMAIIALSSAIAGLWFIVSAYLVLSFHLLIGGSL